jgi:hypothetical protein
MSSDSSTAVGDKRMRQQLAAGSSAVAAEMPRRVQPRHFHAGPNPVSGERDEKADESTPSAPRLHSHALESVFAFCSLKELVPLLRVSKDWAAAVQSMRPLQARLPDVHDEPSLLRICKSPVSRHVGMADVAKFPLSASTLYVLALRMSNLQGLQCSVDGAWSPLVFPTRLRWLNLTLKAATPLSDKQRLELDDVITAMAALPHLEVLKVTAPKAEGRCLTPLATASALRSLTWILDPLDSPISIDALRNMPHLRSLSFNVKAAAFTRMLQMPHQMKLDTLIMFGPFTAEHGKAIVHLAPTLTDVSFSLDSQHTDFFHQMPNLRRLVLGAGKCTLPPDADRIMNSLQSLVGLADLRLYGAGRFPLRFTSDHLAACLPHLPLLTSLQLSYATALGSLRFLASGPITRSLKMLDLDHFNPRLPLPELLHVHALSVLSSLTLRLVFDRPLDDHALPLYTPPSSLIPSLRHFVHEWESV